MQTVVFTEELLIKLKKVFSPELIIPEWSATKNSEDDFNRTDYYAPRVDVAIGPFNTNRDIEKNNQTFENLIQENINLIKKLYDLSHLGENREYLMFDDFLLSLNKNPRCFIALEIENTKAAKRALGDIVNASVMGKIGIVVPIGNDKYEMFIKIKKYFHYLEQVGKFEGNFRNLLIIEASKFNNGFPNELSQR